MEKTLERMFPTLPQETIAEVALGAPDLEQAVAELRKRQKDRLVLTRAVALPTEPAFSKALSTAVPMPIVLVTALDADGGACLCTVGAWSLVNAVPRMYGVALCEREAGPAYPGFWRRHTSAAVDATNEFAINIPHAGLADAWIAAASRSRTREPSLDKFALAGLTPAPAKVIRAPLVAECPVSIECVVRARLQLPTHDWVVGEAVAVHSALGGNDLRVAGFSWPPAPTLSLNTSAQ